MGAAEQALMDSEGWIEWEGGECPVPLDTIVQVKFQLMDGESAAHSSAVTARSFWWNHRTQGGKPDAGNIIAYRIVRPRVASSHTPVPFNPKDGCPQCKWLDTVYGRVLDQKCDLHQKIEGMQAAAALGREMDRSHTELVVAFCEAIGAGDEDNPVEVAKDRMAQLRALEASVPAGWKSVPMPGTRVKADHPITPLNPEETFVVHAVNVDSDGKVFVRGEATMWFHVNMLSPASPPPSAQGRPAAKHMPDPEAWNYNLDEAPKDGTEVWLQSGLMESPVVGKWGKYLFHLTDTYLEFWSLTRDPLVKQAPLCPGQLVTPSKWQPFASPALAVTEAQNEIDSDLLEDFREDVAGPGVATFPKANIRKLIAEIDRLRAAVAERRS